MTITTSKIRSLVALIPLAPYNYDYKQEYRKLGQAILRQLAKDIGLQKGEYDIRWNPGGIAIPGDHNLHTDRFYLAFHDNLNSGWFFWRKCHGRKDFGAGMDCPNQNVTWESIMNGGIQTLVNTLKKVQFEG